MEDLSSLELFFLTCGALGGIYVIIRLIMQVAGVADDGDGGDFDADLDGDADGFDTDQGADSHFTYLSVHGLSAFLMMFGFTGFAMYNQSELGVYASIGGGIAAGVAAVWLLGMLYKSIYRLQSSGTLPIEAAVGTTGQVYANIPAEGRGQVQITVANRLREFEALSKEKTPLATGTPVEVVEVAGDAVVVRKIDA
mgnify:FL=1